MMNHEKLMVCFSSESQHFLYIMMSEDCTYKGLKWVFKVHFRQWHQGIEEMRR